MGWESFGVIGFDFGLLHQGQMRIAKIKSAYNLFVLLEVCNAMPTYWKSWAKNLLMWSDFTLGPPSRLSDG